ncbi:MAG: HNH endonuclease [Candidatus Riesia sp.]|nr:HNH endonuclease [Candidatus Riesia sp.]
MRIRKADGYDRRGLHESVKDYVKEQQGHKCAKCCQSKQLTIHHIIPYSEGGSHKIRNLIALCFACHKEWHRLESKKRNLNFEHWLGREVIRKKQKYRNNNRGGKR